MKSARSLETVERTLETIRSKTPAYGELTDRFGALFRKSASLHDDLIARGVGAPRIDAARVAAGVPVLAEQELEPWVKEFEQAAEVLISATCEALRLDDAASEKLAEIFSDPETVTGLVRARIMGDWQHFENTSVQQDAPPSNVLLYASETVGSPVLRAMVHAMGESLSTLSWEEGHCPVCGSSPSISHLSPKEVTELDQLVGGGGKKFLHCSLCGHDWRFKRNACPSCGNDENDSREIFYVDDTRFERIEACHKCGKYCLNVDLREFEPHPHLDAIQMGLIHLDMHAQSNSLTPLTPTLWNNVE